MHTESSEFKDRAFEVEVDHHVLGPGPFVFTTSKTGGTI